MWRPTARRWRSGTRPTWRPTSTPSHPQPPARRLGELLDAQGLAGPDAANFVVWDGVGAPVITDGPYAESKELLAGYRLVEVETEARALEIAAQASAAPSPVGPIRQPIEVRQVMGAPGDG